MCEIFLKTEWNWNFLKSWVKFLNNWSFLKIDINLKFSLKLREIILKLCGIHLKIASNSLKNLVKFFRNWMNFFVIFTPLPYFLKIFFTDISANTLLIRLLKMLQAATVLIAKPSKCQPLTIYGSPGLC